VRAAELAREFERRAPKEIGLAVAAAGQVVVYSILNVVMAAKSRKFLFLR
jgi:hypothetical protein